MAEFAALSFPTVIARLLAQNKHAVAMRICDVFNSHSNREYQKEDSDYFDRFRGLVAMDWATRKIQSSNESSESLAATVFSNIIRIARRRLSAQDRAVLRGAAPRRGNCRPRAGLRGDLLRRRPVGTKRA